jgi:DNA invertase Pin-like site-specific DNA recombinase
MRTGALIGHARVSTSGQLLDRQQHALAEAGCLRVFADKLSGKDADRPELAACLDYLRPGDTLVVPSLDRLSRSLADLIGIVGTLRRQGVGFKSLHEALDTTTPGGRLVFHVFAALAAVIGLFIWARIDDQRQRSFVMGYPGSAARLSGSRRHPRQYACRMPSAYGPVTQVRPGDGEGPCR